MLSDALSVGAWAGLRTGMVAMLKSDKKSNKMEPRDIAGTLI